MSREAYGFFSCQSLELVWAFLVVDTDGGTPRITDSLITEGHLGFSRCHSTDVS